jgi:hypothetical protein
MHGDKKVIMRVSFVTTVLVKPCLRSLSLQKHLRNRLPLVPLHRSVGASDNTKSQVRLNYPYILVRSIVVDAFYSINFAPMVRYARDRFLMLNGS